MPFPNITRGSSLELDSPIDHNKISIFQSNDGSTILTTPTEVTMQLKGRVDWPFQQNKDNPSQVILKVGFLETTDMEHIQSQFNGLNSAIIEQLRSKDIKRKLKEAFPSFKDNMIDDNFINNVSNSPRKDNQNQKVYDLPKFDMK